MYIHAYIEIDIDMNIQTHTHIMCGSNSEVGKYEEQADCSKKGWFPACGWFWDTIDGFGSGLLQGCSSGASLVSS